MIMTGALMFDSIIGLACGVTHVGLDFRLSEINRPDVWWWLILTLSNAFLGIDNREMKSESGFSFAIASQPLQYYFLGPRGPLVEPSMSTRPVPQQFFLSSYIQAYMPYGSSEVSSNQPDGTKGSHRCPLDPLGPCRPTPWPPGTL